jgi:hypothetical protein
MDVAEPSLTWIDDLVDVAMQKADAMSDSPDPEPNEDYQRRIKAVTQ